MTGYDTSARASLTTGPETATALLVRFLRSNLVARSTSALDRFVAVAAECSATGTLGTEHLDRLRDLWWSTAAPASDQFRAYYQEVFLPARVAELDALLGRTPARVIDIGFGDGAVLDALANHWGLPAQDVVGVETAPLEPGHRPHQFASVAVPSSSDWALPLPSRSADVVLIQNVLHHTTLPTPDTVLSEAARVVTDTGAVLIREHDVTTPEQARFLAMLEVVFDTILTPAPAAPAENATCYRSAVDWLHLVERAGLQPAKVVFLPSRSTHLDVDILARPR